MLESFEIRNFKGLRQVKLEQLAAVNLIVGKNNVGKSRVLEAISLWAAGRNPEQLFRLLAQREGFVEGTVSLEVFEEWFEAGDEGCMLGDLTIRRVEADCFEMWQGGDVARFSLSSETCTEDSSVTRMPFVLYAGGRDGAERLEHWWQGATAAEREGLLVEVRSIVDAGGHEDLWGIGRWGNGMRNVAGIVLAARQARGGVLLLDGIEDGLYWSVWPRLCGWILEVVKRWNLQVFATTQSAEVVREFANSEASAIVRLESFAGELRLVRYNGGRAAISLDNGYEVR